MDIASSNIRLSSKYSMLEKYEYTENLSFWSNNKSTGSSIESFNQPPLKDKVSISSDSRKLLDTKGSNGEKDAKIDDNMYVASMGDFKLMVLKVLLERMTGKKIDVSNIVDGSGKADGSKVLETASDNTLQQPPLSNPSDDSQQPQGWGLQYSSHETKYERQEYAFNASGTIKTKDGLEINFHLDVNMSYEHTTETSTSLSAGDAKLTDPLIINFGGNAADLTGGTFNFDLNSDGQTDKMPMLGAGSGFLSFDSNNDGVINNGKELFGPSTGNGYSELSAYDEDKNNWIDKNDSVFDKLSVLRNSQNGESSLSTLQDNAVSALYLGNIGGWFDYKDGAGNLIGRLAGMSLFTKNDGTVGTTQQVDMHT
ncbi:MAG: hypothetical protein H7844_04055 [Nitrospirae bacterium YQR-1]